MKFLFDLFPVVLFFVAFKLADIYVATGVAIAATFAQVGWLNCPSLCDSAQVAVEGLRPCLLALVRRAGVATGKAEHAG